MQGVARQSKQAGSHSIDSVYGFTRVTLSNDCIRLTVLPHIGGKMTSIRRIASEREFLLQPADRVYQQGSYGARFEDYDSSGFDECLPTVAACQYPEGKFVGTVIPDHGEVWSIPWQYQVHENELKLAAAGSRLPYIFRKRVRLQDDAVIVGYELESVTDEPFRYLWSAHPLLSVETGCRIILPAEVSRVLVNSSRHNRLGTAGSECSWPIHNLGYHGVDLSVIGSKTDRTSDKLFTDRLAQGWCAVHYPVSDESICFRFDSEVVPYVGIWACYGGWPNNDHGHFTAALEPCTSRFDSLAEAISQQECELLAPRETKNWELRIEVKQGLQKEFTSR
jgi:hypothetical protein